MPDPSNNPPQKETEASDEKGEKHPSVRTMKSDIEELFKNTKPSLVQILSKEVSMSSPRVPQENKIKIPYYIARIALPAAVLLVAVLASVLLFGQREEMPPKKMAAPPGYFATESSRTITVREKDRPLLLRLISDSAREFERSGTIKRILIKIQKNSGEEVFAKTSDVFRFYRITPPGELPSLLESHIMPFFFYTNREARFGFAARIQNPDRVLRDFIQWESSLSAAFRPFFFDKKIEESVAPFEDRAYRNIDWRYIKLSQEEDIGIGYVIFPAKNLLVVATSKEAMETIINRLFETR